MHTLAVYSVAMRGYEAKNPEFMGSTPRTFRLCASFICKFLGLSGYYLYNIGFYLFLCRVSVCDTNRRFCLYDIMCVWRVNKMGWAYLLFCFLSSFGYFIGFFYIRTL
ncbi:hypothetical protein BDD12DRAFT_352210 [Trichophaea hybrida]|nr:hypothetical protein BDD12DRAFT_352210 [Trichophaea hybrida]